MNRPALRARGSALVEWLVALPVLLLVGLGVLQLALVLQMRGVLEYATQLAVRQAALAHGHGHAIEAGLLDGLRPAWQHTGAAQGQARLAQALAAGWLQWERRFPDPPVLADFAVGALDEWGRPLAGEREIPNDNLRFRPDQPGARSGLTLTEANRIEVELRYGVLWSCRWSAGFLSG
ncbi:MAG: TadE/TadG family type IV pilus assembly protein [Burkholderiaceae bacterium]